MNKKGSIALVILGLVAVIALVGLIVLFTKGSPTGQALIPPCTDFDGGLNYNVKGEVISFYPEYHTFEDHCTISPSESITQPSQFQLVEYYCKDSVVASKTYACPHGCANGACLVQPSKRAFKANV